MSDMEFEFVLDNGVKYHLELWQDFANQEYLTIYDDDGYHLRDLYIVNGQIDWSVEKIGRFQMPDELQHMADKLIANRAFL